MKDWGSLLDKLAEKLGVAVEALRPLAETVVREYVLMHIFWGGALLLAAAASVAGIRWSLRIPTAVMDDDNPARVLLPLLLGLAALVFFLVGMMSVAQALAPHYGLLRSLTRGHG